MTSPLLQREKILLSARIPGSDPEALCRSLPSLDPELLFRAEAALASGQLDRCGRLLAAVENPRTAPWNLLMGKLSMAREQWEEAAGYLENAEETQALPLLETCFRERGDFRRAYECACRQRR